MNQQALLDSIHRLGNLSQDLAQEMSVFQTHMDGIAQLTATHSPFMHYVTVFLLACFVGYYVVWRVTPALHAPLMAVTNAISSVVIVGALLAAFSTISTAWGYVALVVASINIFGGFIITRRMLSMLAAKKPNKTKN